MTATAIRGRAVSSPRGRRRRLLARDGFACWWCHEPFGPERPMTIDHLTPKARGGSDEDDNLVLACDPCNSSRPVVGTCAGCGHRIRKWRAAVWVARRESFHRDCARRRLVA